MRTDELELKNKENLIEAIITDTPKAFWKDVRAQAKIAYADVYNNIASDPNLVECQKMLKIPQDRHFRMEHVLFEVANRHGMPSSDTLLPSNGFNFVYVGAENIGLTQSYVKGIGDMPVPAKYREKLAESNKTPGLDFNDEPRSLRWPKTVYGMIAHSPVGNKFDEANQKLGMVQLCIPSKDCKSWTSQIAIQEIISAYTVDSSESKSRQVPVLKTKISADEA